MHSCSESWPSCQLTDALSMRDDGYGVFRRNRASFSPIGGFPSEGSYRHLRQSIGRGILLGLELLVAGDIIRTVAITPTFVSVGVLGLIVVIRTFLSFALEVELTGWWPWQAEPDGRAAESAGGV